MSVRPVQLQRMGMTMDEGTIVRWLVQPGEAVTEGQVLLEVETDKVTLQVPAPAGGILGTHLVAPDKSVPVGTTLCYLLEEGESEDGPLQADAAPSAPVVEQTRASAPAARARDDRIRATPRARRLAAELGIDLASLAKPDERITEDDVRAAANARAQLAPELEPVRGIRKITAERMTHSFQNIPHFYLTVECDASNLLAWRSELLSDPDEGQGVRVTITDLILKLTAQALCEYPLVNASWTNDGIQRHPEINIGVATDTPEGLVVPVLKAADKKSVIAIAHARQTLVERARSRTLAPDDVQGGSFTLTNLGMFSVDAVNAIINPPESAILAVGRIKNRPAVAGGALVIRPTVFFTLSGDHRLLDGVMGARFLTRLAELFENPRASG
jgi:pyruvate dehydrogenase E2 component (dihydrolipoamide acetyltransferase)